MIDRRPRDPVACSGNQKLDSVCCVDYESCSRVPSGECYYPPPPIFISTESVVECVAHLLNIWKVTASNLGLRDRISSAFPRDFQHSL